MMLRILTLLILLSFPSLAQDQQESMLQDVSYPYLEKLIEVAKANYPKVKAFNSRISVANTAIEKAKRGYFDALSFSYLYSPRNTTTIVNPNLLNGYQFGLLLNVGAVLQKPVLLKQAREEQKVVVHEKEAFDLNLEADVKQRYFTYVQQQALLRIKRQALLDVESMLKQVRYKYEKGEETLESYNKVLVMFSDHNQGKIIAEGDVLNAKARLEELLGEKLENIKLN